MKVGRTLPTEFFGATKPGGSRFKATPGGDKRSELALADDLEGNLDIDLRVQMHHHRMGADGFDV
jgi:hypothetical protein